MSHYQYKQIVGTGGIGYGMLFQLEGDHTLGRNESRAGILTPFKDYCKLHIIFHYIAVFLKSDQFAVRAIGSVGADEVGERLRKEMRDAGIDTSFVKTDARNRTLFSVCFQYPDSSGGNITSSNSASSHVLPADVEHFFEKEKMSEPQNGREQVDFDTLVMAVPEVCIDTRIHLLTEGKARGSFNIASILSGEVDVFAERNGFALVDLLAINFDEAMAIVSYFDRAFMKHTEGKEEFDIMTRCVEILKKANPDMLIAITNGSKGSYGYCNGNLIFTPCTKVDAIGTAGAGDAFLAGTIIGLCCGLPFVKEKNDNTFSETSLTSAIEFGTLTAAMAVTSTDTINHEVNAVTLYQFIEENNIMISDDFAAIFKDRRQQT